MAKNNINLGTLQGKLGDNVFYRALGQQRVRAYFKRDHYFVNEQQAEFRAKYSNLKALYKWLPDTWKRACRTYRPGETAFSSFMRQYNKFSALKDRYTSGVGQFIPVNAQISAGTMNVAMETRCGELLEVSSEEEFIGMSIKLGDPAFGAVKVADISLEILNYYPTLREGDIIHFVCAYMYWDEETWGIADSVEGFPFAYDKMAMVSFALDKHDQTFITSISPSCAIGSKYGEGDDVYWGIIPQLEIWSAVDKNFLGAVGAVLVERTTATRQQRFSSSRLEFYHSQFNILSERGKESWMRYAKRTFVSE